MSLTKKIILVLFLLLISLVFYTFWSTGFFRTVENRFEGETVFEIPIWGAEDITVSTSDSFAIVSSTKRGVYPPTEEEKGGLYYLELKSGNFVLTHLTADLKMPFAPHGISMFKRDSIYTIVAINHTPEGHSLEFFTLVGKLLTHQKTLRSTWLVSPNDIVLLDEDRFYMSNDHGYNKGIGKLAEEYGNLAASNVICFDGTDYSEVANGIAYANGINFDEGRNLLFVSSPRRFLIKVYERTDDGKLTFVEDIPCGTGVDNIEFDEQGDLWVGCHPNLLRFAAYAKGKKETAPSEILKIAYRGKGNFTVESIYTNDGSQVSGTSVAARLGALIFAGTVKDDKMVVLRQKGAE
jgi:arylesterase/paraoxonase